jgi:CMP-N,N'-diacetyllegionaminic acid synthase
MSQIIISLIPAKEKSGKIKNKNLLKIEKKTLLEISILTSINCKKIHQTYVSSESKKILKIAKKYKCEIVNRPANLSTNAAKGIDVIKHFAKSLDKNLAKLNPIIIILQPTSPLRTIKDIQNSIKIFKKKKLDFLISVKENKISPFKDLIIKKNKLVPITEIKNIFENRQSFPKTFKPNGAIFIFSYKSLLKKNISLDKSFPYIMDDISSIDVDTVNDYKLVKKYFKRNHGK